MRNRHPICTLAFMRVVNGDVLIKSYVRTQQVLLSSLKERPMDAIGNDSCNLLQTHMARSFKFSNMRIDLRYYVLVGYL